MTKKVTVPQLADFKGGRRLRMVTSYDYPTARLIDATPIETILVGDSLGMVVLGYESTLPVTVEEMIHHSRAVVRGAPQTLVFADLPFLSYEVGPEEAVRNAGRLLKEAGVDGVKLEGGAWLAETVRRLVRSGIPVVGHLGLTPQRTVQLGGYKVQGRTVESARELLADALALQEAGISLLVLECVPAEVGAWLTERLAVPTVGIGAGPGCDGQVLVLHDLLGLYDRFTPRFVKRYAELAPAAREALERYAAEVAEGTFPGAEHSFSLSPEERARLMAGDPPGSGTGGPGGAAEGGDGGCAGR